MAHYYEDGRRRGHDIPMHAVNSSHYYDHNVHPSQVTLDVPESYRPGRRGSDAPSYKSSDDGMEREREEDMERQRELLMNLPSAQLSHQMMEGYKGHRTLRRKSSMRHRKRSHHIHHGTVRMHGSNVAQELVREIENSPDYMDGDMDEVEVTEHLRGMTSATLATKRQVRQDIQRSSEKRVATQGVGAYKRFKYNLSIQYSHFKQKLADIRYSLRFWHGHLKKIEGHFGTGVTSYFRFLKWLFIINIPVFLLSFFFIVLPEMLFRGPYCQMITFNVTDLLTGGGWLSETLLYYGFYTNESIELHLSKGHYYNMQHAYLFTSAAYYICSLILVMISLSKSYKINYIQGSGEFSFYYVSKVFCGWDYGITDKDAGNLKHKALYNELQEYLAGYHEEKNLTCQQRCGWFSLRVFTNLIVLGMIGGAGYVIWYISETQSVRTNIPVLSSLAMPLCVSSINLLFPFAFSVISSFERYSKPKYELYITMARTILLKGTTLAVLIYFWFNDVDCNLNSDEKQSKSHTCEQAPVFLLTLSCWETFMGEQIYMLVLVDFVFVLLITFFSEFIRRIMSQFCCKSLGHPEFNIGRNTLNLIYSQALVWLGSFYSPLLPVIQLIKLFITFYVKRVSVIQNCVPSLKPWRAARAHTTFLILLLLAFFVTVVAVVYSIVFIKPSETCGPYRGMNESYEVVTEMITSWQDEVRGLGDAIAFITSPGFVAGIITVLSIFVYYTHEVTVGHKAMVELMKRQLQMEGRDKVFLLKMLQDVNKKAPAAEQVNRRVQTLHQDLDNSGVGLPMSPGGRTFAKVESAAKDAKKMDSPAMNKKGKKYLATQEQEDVGSGADSPSRRRKDIMSGPAQGTPPESRHGQRPYTELWVPGSSSNNNATPSKAGPDRREEMFNPTYEERSPRNERKNDPDSRYRQDPVRGGSHQSMEPRGVGHDPRGMGHDPQGMRPHPGQDPRGMEPYPGQDPRGMGMHPGQDNRGMGPYPGQDPRGVGMHPGQDPRGLGMHPGQDPRGMAPYPGQDPRGMGMHPGQDPRGMGPYPGQDPRGVGMHPGQDPRGMGPYPGQDPRGMAPYPGQDPRGMGMHPGQDPRGMEPYPGQDPRGMGPHPGQDPRGMGPYPGQDPRGMGPYPGQDPRGMEPYPGQDPRGMGPLPGHGQRRKSKDNAGKKNKRK
ncbi:transmembrane channel-like protein 6 [Lingula anatina]|uniref:Transmembrane channel-like protein 6 n=1 Tax=Lingula anatina TaxID=7574 RepID=A0A1S3JEJ6_LINAN|nr:transmembrane channel-like protein 6 [Lingula anatina]|eukprot:XP_013408571.1 transmembrane channel-like protein 6 [Lingula anatina]